MLAAQAPIMVAGKIALQLRRCGKTVRQWWLGVEQGREMRSIIHLQRTNVKQNAAEKLPQYNPLASLVYQA